MHVLITNDDGIYAEGLKVLIRELRKIAEVTVVAPDRERSAIGHSLTCFEPLRVQKIKVYKKCQIYSSTGTPSDCIILALYDILSVQPDLIISGINRGGNLGNDIIYSGTVAAVVEGLLHEIPGFAISLVAYENCYYDFAARFACKLAQVLMVKQLPEKTLLNVNVPNIKEEKIRGVEITYQGQSIYRNKLEKRIDPRGQVYYWIGGDKPQGRLEDGSDFKAIVENKVAITPLQLDLTNYRLINELKGWKLVV